MALSLAGNGSAAAVVTTRPNPATLEELGKRKLLRPHFTRSKFVRAAFVEFVRACDAVDLELPWGVYPYDCGHL